MEAPLWLGYIALAVALGGVVAVLLTAAVSRFRGAVAVVVTGDPTEPLPTLPGDEPDDLTDAEEVF